MSALCCHYAGINGGRYSFGFNAVIQHKTINFVFLYKMQVVPLFCFNKLRTLACPSTARSIWLSCGEMNKYAAREGRFLAKVMRSGTKKKKYWNSFENNSVPSATQIASSTGGKSAKRVVVLNKLFMKNITGLMATGEVAAEILGKGVEISKVKVAPDFNLVNVYWCAKGTAIDEEIENTLQSVAGQLRHELSQLRVMGVVPRIQFVKDKHYSKTAEVERLLQTADFGEDYIPTTESSRIQSEFAEENLLNQGKQGREASGDSLINEEEYSSDMDLPAMRMDVLGLDHSAIMTKIVRDMKKAKASHRFEVPEKIVGTMLPDNDADQSMEYLTPKQRRLELSKFLTHRKAFKDKTRKQSHLDLEMSEDNINHTNSFNQFLDNDKEEQDFIEEDDDSYLGRH